MQGLFRSTLSFHVCVEFVQLRLKFGLEAIRSSYYFHGALIAFLPEIYLDERMN